jgi:hypothetical protein
VPVLGADFVPVALMKKEAINSTSKPRPRIFPLYVPLALYSFLKVKFTKYCLYRESQRENIFRKKI